VFQDKDLDGSKGTSSAEVIRGPQAKDDAVSASAVAGKRTLDSISGADAINEALEMAENERERQQLWLDDKRAVYMARLLQDQHGKGQKKISNKSPGEVTDETVLEAMGRCPSNPLMLGLTPEQYVLRAVGSIRTSELQQALFVLPFTDAMRLLEYLNYFMVTEEGDKVELVCNVAVMLVRIHQGQLSSLPDARPVLQELREKLRARIMGMKNTMGFNLAGCRHVARRARAKEVVDM